MPLHDHSAIKAVFPYRSAPDLLTSCNNLLYQKSKMMLSQIRTEKTLPSVFTIFSTSGHGKITEGNGDVPLTWSDL